MSIFRSVEGGWQEQRSRPEGFGVSMTSTKLLIARAYLCRYRVAAYTQQIRGSYTLQTSSIYPGKRYTSYRSRVPYSCSSRGHLRYIQKTPLRTSAKSHALQQDSDIKRRYFDFYATAAFSLTIACPPFQILIVLAALFSSESTPSTPLQPPPLALVIQVSIAV